MPIRIRIRQNNGDPIGSGSTILPKTRSCRGFQYPDPHQFSSSWLECFLKISEKFKYILFLYWCVQVCTFCDPIHFTVYVQYIFIFTFAKTRGAVEGKNTRLLCCRMICAPPPHTNRWTCTTVPTLQRVGKSKSALSLYLLGGGGRNLSKTTAKKSGNSSITLFPPLENLSA